jgi:creatinine amidohydrolase
MGDHGGGQDALKRVAVELDREWSAKGAHVYYVGDLYFKSQQQAREYLSKRGKTMGTHAGISDSSEVMYLDKEGKWIRRDKLAAGEKDSGVDGDPRDASSELGKAILDFKVQAAVEQIRSLTSAKR